MTYRYEIESITIPAINFFITPSCNMKCRFCFGEFIDNRPLSLEKKRKLQLEVIQFFADAGIKKITFVGGEPLLCPWLVDLITFAHDLGLCTCVVTNGALLTEKWIHDVSTVLDWIGISIDSIIPETNISSGRSVMGRPLLESDYRERIEWIHKAGIKLKINTTITLWNCNEDMSDFFIWASPERLKIFQSLKIDGVNSSEAINYVVSDQIFFKYVKNHQSKGVNLIAETAEDMKGSYLMASPDGRFFENISGLYRFSSSILDVGYDKALSEIKVSSEKFMKRGGHYNWS